MIFSIKGKVAILSVNKKKERRCRSCSDKPKTEQYTTKAFPRHQRLIIFTKNQFNCE